MLQRIFLFTTLFFTLFGVAPHAWALDVLDVRFGKHPDKVRSVIELSETSDFRAFMLEGPYRLVIDMPSFSWKVGGFTNLKDYGLTSVRTGQLDAGVSRIVYEINRPATIGKAFILPKQGANPDRLVIDFVPGDIATFKAQKDKIFGKFDPQKSPDNMRITSALNPAAAPSEMVRPPTKPTSSNNTPNNTPAAPPKRREKPLIVLDPGHGGNDPGAVGHDHKHEKHVVLALAKELKSQLEASGQYRVKLTRYDDRYIRLRDRIAFARKHGADLFISVHADSINKPNVSGASVYTLSETASDSQTAKLAARENRSDIIAGVDLDVEDEEVANILVDLAMRDTMNQSNFVAGKLVDNFRARSIRLLQNPHRSAGFAVLKAPDIPSVLVEAGFMSNRKEAQMLSRGDYRRRIAGALKDGINAYFAKVRQNERG